MELSKQTADYTDRKYKDPRNPGGPAKSRYQITLEDFENMASSNRDVNMDTAAREAGKAAAKETADQVQERWDKFKNWANENKGALIGAGVGAAGIYALYRWWNWNQIQKRRAAERADLAKKLALVQQHGGDPIIVKSAMASLSDEEAVHLYDMCIPKMAEFIKTAASCGKKHKKRKKRRKTREKNAKKVKSNIKKTAAMRPLDSPYRILEDNIYRGPDATPAELYAEWEALGMELDEEWSNAPKEGTPEWEEFQNRVTALYDRQGVVQNALDDTLAKTAKERVDTAVWNLFKEAGEKTPDPFAVFALAQAGDGYAGTTRAADRGEEGKVGLPGGKVDPGEDPVDAVLREAAEEGWDLSNVEKEPAHKAMVDGNPVWWYLAEKAKERKKYKEQGRISPVTLALADIAKSGYGNEWVEGLEKKASGPLFERGPGGKPQAKGRVNTDKQAQYPAPAEDEDEDGDGFLDVPSHTRKLSKNVEKDITPSVKRLDRNVETLVNLSRKMQDPKTVKEMMIGPTGGALAGAGIGTLAAHLMSDRQPLDYLTGGLVGSGVGSILAVLARNKAERVAQSMQSTETAVG